MLSPTDRPRARGVAFGQAARGRPCYTPAVPAPPVSTPCIKVCVVDGESGLCLGCLRTLPEIGGWSGLSEAQRAAVMAELPARRERLAPGKRW